MNAERKDRSRIVIAVAVAMVVAVVVWLNIVTRVNNEDGSPILRTNYKSPPRRLMRSNGWPNPVWVRVNWGTIENGSFKFDEQMRPKESAFELAGLAKNVTVLALLAAIALLSVSAVYRRQFSLRKLLLFAFFAALLVLLIRPYIRSEMERREHIREFERWMTKYGR